jgi:hypothetical protein
MLSQSESYALFKEMMQQPWVETSEDSACINYGLSYSMYGGAAEQGEIEISKMPPLLVGVTSSVSDRIRMPVNYVQCHRYLPTHPVHPHKDPAGMIVPMLAMGQARSFRYGGTLPHWSYQFPQKRRKLEWHQPEKETLLQSGSLLIFNGGRIVHSMVPASQDRNAQLCEFPYRITILFRYTTQAMRLHGCNKNLESVRQYEAVKKAYRSGLL